jgi:hypothetical protein
VADSNYNFKSYLEKINISIQINVPLFDSTNKGMIKFYYWGGGLFIRFKIGLNSLVYFSKKYPSEK